MTTEPTMECAVTAATTAERTACIAVLAGIPGLILSSIAAASSTALAIRADVVLTILDMLVLITAWVIAFRTRRSGRAATPRDAMAETLACALAALCMSLSMVVVTAVALQRMAGGGLAPDGPGVVLGMAVNFVYAAINLWLLRRWLQRYRVAPSLFVRSQVCLFSDKLASNLVISLSLAAALALDGTMVARFVDPLAGLLIALATARCTAPVIRDAVQSLRASAKHRRTAATGLSARPMTSDAGG